MSARSTHATRADHAGASHPHKTLIVTADDFGRAPEVNEAVEIAHRCGILTAASLMVGAPAAHQAVTIARRVPSLHVGLHLVLVDGVPILPAAQVPDLVDGQGRFHDDMTRVGVSIFFRPTVRHQLAAEIEAQYRAFAATGLVLDHVNAHKHFHVHPTIGRMVIEIGKHFGLRGLRVPSEPHALLTRLEAAAPRPDSMLRPYAALLRRRVRRAGLVAPDRVFGVAWSGAMTGDRVGGLLRRLPDGCTEIYAHPATSDRFDGAEPGYAYAAELEALTSPETLAAFQASGAVRAGFSGPSALR